MSLFVYQSKLQQVPVRIIVMHMFALVCTDLHWSALPHILQGAERGFLFPAVVQFFREDDLSMAAEVTVDFYLHSLSLLFSILFFSSRHMQLNNSNQALTSDQTQKGRYFLKDNEYLKEGTWTLSACTEFCVFNFCPK